MVEAYLLILIVGLFVTIISLARLWPARHLSGAISLVAANVAILIWSVGYILEILSPDLSMKLFWAKVEYLGIAFISVCYLLFLLRYTGRMPRVNHAYLLLLGIIPAMTVIFAATNEIHHWIWTSVRLQNDWLAAPLDLSHGVWFWVHTVYSYLLLFSGTILLVLFARRAQWLFVSQSMIMLAGLVIPWLANVLYVLGVRPGPDLDLTPLAFILTNLTLAFGFMRYRLLDVLPVAHASIFKAMSDGVIVLDLKDRMIDANPAAQRIFRQNHELRLGNNIRQLLPNWQNSTEMKPGGQQILLGVEKERRTYTMQVSTLGGGREKITGRIAIFTDVTELKYAHDQMALQVTALNSAENAFVITNESGQIEWINPAFTRLTGYTLEDALGQTPRILKSGRHPDSFYRELWQTILSGKVWRGEMINRRKDGSFYHEEMTITPLVDFNGSTSHFIAVKQDISVRRQAEELLKQAHEEALEANRLKTQMLANVSHDVRTPLGAIIGFVEMLNLGIYGEVNPQQSTILGEILDSSQQLLMFVNNLIGQAQLDTGKLILNSKPFPLNELVEVAQSTAGPLAEKKGLALRCEVDPLLPRSMIGDVYWLRQIVLNLVANAVKFTDSGSVCFRLVKAGGDSWNIEVADTGIGVPDEAQAKIFEPFQQVDSSDTRRHTGSGLGLAIVKELTTLMGGTTWVQSKVGSGSTFVVNLPLMKGEWVNGRNTST